MSSVINQVKKTIKQGVKTFIFDWSGKNVLPDLNQTIDVQVAQWLDENPTFVIDQISATSTVSAGRGYDNLAVLYHYETTNDERS